MITLYALFLITFLGYPIIAIIASYLIKFDDISKLMKYVFAFFLVHNILFLLGISFRGDPADYVVFSMEYLALCLVTNVIPKAFNIYYKIFGFCGLVIICPGLLMGLLGAVFFPAMDQDYELDRFFQFSANGKSYETRRYTFGTIGSINTRYTFETYQIFSLLPLEMKIDETDFFEQQTNLNISEPDLQIAIIHLNNKQQIVFKSSNGHTFAKLLD